MILKAANGCRRFGENYEGVSKIVLENIAYKVRMSFRVVHVPSYTKQKREMEGARNSMRKQVNLIAKSMGNAVKPVAIQLNLDVKNVNLTPVLHTI